MASIWLLKQHGTLPNTPGGTRQWDMAQGLADRGHDVTFVLSGFDHTTKTSPKNFQGKNYLLDRYENVTVLWINSIAYDSNNWRRSLNALDFTFRLYLTSKVMSPEEWETVKTPDIVIAVSLPLFAPLAAYRIAKDKKADFFIEVSDIWPQVLADMGKMSENALVFRLLKRLEIFLYRKAKGIISPFPEFTSYLEQYHMEDKFSWVPRGIIGNQPPAKNRSGKTNLFRIVYIGAHGPANGLHEVIEAFKQLKKHPIELALYGDGIEKEYLKKRVITEKLNNIIFKDAVPKSEIFNILFTADAFLLLVKPLPVHQYGIFPNKLADYLWAGKPIITNKGADNGLVDRLKCGITVPINNPKALADAVCHIANKSFEELKQMGDSGKRYAENFLKMDNVIDQLETAIGL